MGLKEFPEGKTLPSVSLGAKAYLCIKFIATVQIQEIND